MGGFNDYYGQTVIHPVGLTATLILGVAMLLLPRRLAFLPMLLLACFIPSAQRLIVLGADFNLLRILVLFGWMRLFVRNEFKGFSWNTLDTFIVAWMVSGSVIFTLQQGTMAIFINRLGWMFDGFGMYFLFRCVIRSWVDVERVALSFIVVSIPVMLVFLVERATGRNAFAIFGGVPDITVVREGRLRCQGAFSHPILAGCFWVSVMPMMATQWLQGRKWLATAGLVSALIIAVTCASSTPVMGLMLVVIGMSLYPARRYLRYIRWGTVACLVLLHLVMNKPVWHLMARISAVGGSTGFHRYKLIDATVNNFGKWALMGEGNPLSWGEPVMRDITNQYILEALIGGVLTLALFVAMLTVGFSMVGAAMRRCEGNRLRLWFVWCIGVSLFVHAGGFFGVSYFGQIIMLFYLNLALIGSLPTIAPKPVRRAEPVLRRVQTEPATGALEVVEGGCTDVRTG